MIKTNPYLLRKIIATLVDSFIIFIFFFSFVMTFGHPNETGGCSVEGPLVLIPIIFTYVFVVLFETIFSATIGHLLVSLKAMVEARKEFDKKQATRQNAGAEEQRLSQSVLTTVNAYLLRYGKKQGYKMMLIAANGNIATTKKARDAGKMFKYPGEGVGFLWR